MKIPNELRNLDFDTYEAISSLVDPAKKGEIISVTALVEEEILKTISGSSPPSKTLKKKTFAGKIKSLEAHFNKNEKHQAQKEKVLTFVKMLRDIRNLTGHTYSIGFSDLSTLEQNHPGAKLFLSNFPKSLWDAVADFNKNLQTISKIKL